MSCSDDLACMYELMWSFFIMRSKQANNQISFIDSICSDITLELLKHSCIVSSDKQLYINMLSITLLLLIHVPVKINKPI